MHKFQKNGRNKMIQRIQSLNTFEGYKKDLETLIPKYIKKSKDIDTKEDIFNEIEFNLHNPYFYACIINTKDKVNGFFTVKIQSDLRKKIAVIDHFYCPNNAGDIYKIIEKEMENNRVKKENIMFLSYRLNNKAWLKGAKKLYDIDFEPVALVLRRKNG